MGRALVTARLAVKRLQEDDSGISVRQWVEGRRRLHGAAVPEPLSRC